MWTHMDLYSTARWSIDLSTSNALHISITWTARDNVQNSWPECTGNEYRCRLWSALLQLTGKRTPYVERMMISGYCMRNATPTSTSNRVEFIFKPIDVPQPSRGCSLRIYFNSTYEMHRFHCVSLRRISIVTHESNASKWTHTPHGPVSMVATA